MESVYAHSVWMLQALQNHCQGIEELLFTVSRVGDPGSVFTVLFPLLYCLRPSFGRRMVWVIVLSEWLNLVLKWILHGQRPYWWVRETDFYRDAESPPLLKQFSGTCETGPGSPSGHCMAVTASGFVFVSVGLKHLKRNFLEKKVMMQALVPVSWFGFVVFLAMINLSRMYIATHFPHQAALGTFIGALVGLFVASTDIAKFNFRQYMLSTVAIFAITLGVHAALLFLKFDPDWSVSMATRWCENADWVHVTTTPFHTLARVTGAVFGLGLGVGLTDLILHDASQDQPLNFSKPSRVLAIPLSITFAVYAEGIHVPHDSMAAFYVLSFLKIAIITFSVAGVIPNIINKIFSEKSKNKCEMNGHVKLNSTTNGHVKSC